MYPTNLWGDLPVLDNVRTPLLILKEQAAQLGEMTEKILIAEISKPEIVVNSHTMTITERYIMKLAETSNMLSNNSDSESRKHNDTFGIDFDIVVPTMNFYRITILRMEYFLKDMYPVFLFNELEQSPQALKANNEQEFTNVLKSILTSTEVKKVLSTLLVYAKAS